MKRCDACGEDKTPEKFEDGRAVCMACRSRAKRDADRQRQDAQRLERAVQIAPYGTPTQRLAAETFARLGSIETAAETLGVSPQGLRYQMAELERVAARAGWLPGEAVTATPPAAFTPQGYEIKGTSTLVGADGTIRGQWIKTKQSEDSKLARLMDAVQALAEPFKGLAEPAARPVALDDDLLCVYPMGDPHFGMMAWAAETGEDFDLKIAENDLIAAVDHLVGLAPPARHALIIELGDFFHTDNSSNQTSRSHHALDVDSRWSKMLGIGIRAMRRNIDRALEKHELVHVIIEIGNHDDHTSIMLALCLANYYEREPRVTIDTSPAKFHWYRFGANLIASTHGDTTKANNLPGIMATDRARDWGETSHRFWYTGHVHHDSLKEYPGVIVETFRTLAARDAWHSGQGYRSGRDMKLDVIHRLDGRIVRHSVGIPALRRKAAP